MLGSESAMDGASADASGGRSALVDRDDSKAEVMVRDEQEDNGIRVFEIDVRVKRRVVVVDDCYCC